MTQLITHRNLVAAENAVPAIVDAYAQQHLHLTIGAHFVVNVDSGTTAAISCVTVAVVQHLPTINDSTLYSSTVDNTLSGGLLVDYRSYASIYEQASGEAPPINFVWLRVSHEPGILAHLRSILAAQHVDLVYDRWAMMAFLYNDPLYALQQTLPAQVVIPSSLGIALSILVIICLITLSLMVSLASRSSMSQTLRLNED